MPWVFVYGSLLSDFEDEFEAEEKAKGVLQGYQRDFNKRSTRNWGTSHSPAPVLGLEPGGECIGVAFRIAEDRIDEVVNWIDHREGDSYFKRPKAIQLEDGEDVTASVWINDRTRNTYIGDKSLEERAKMAIHASGEKGSAKQYALMVWKELQNLDIEDSHVEEYVEMVAALTE